MQFLWIPNPHTILAKKSTQLGTFGQLLCAGEAPNRGCTGSQNAQSIMSKTSFFNKKCLPGDRAGDDGAWSTKKSVTSPLSLPCVNFAKTSIALRKYKTGFLVWCDLT